MDYNGRQVDIEWLQTILAPKITPTRLYMQFSPNTKIVAGMQKMAQRFTNTFFTIIGDIKFDPEYGTTFWDDLFHGVAQNMGRVVSAITQAMLYALDAMQGDDTNTTTYGEIADDERIVEADLLDYSIDRNSGTLFIKIKLTSLAGDAYVYTVPVQAIRK